MNPNSEAVLEPVAGVGKRVAKNAAWLLIGRVASQGFAVLFTVLIARRTGEVGLGQYAFITSVIFLGNLSTTFGTDMLIIRELAGKRDFSLLPAALVVQLGLSLPFILLVFILAPFFPNQDSQTIFALQLYSLALIPLAFFSVFSSALRGVEKMDSFTWLNVANGVLLLAVALPLVGAGSSIVTLAVVLLVAQTLSALLAGLLCLTQIPLFAKIWQVSQPVIVRLIRLSLPIAILGLLGALYQRMAIYLISGLRGAAETGLFSAALRVMEAAKIGHIVILGALFPAMAQAAQSRTKRSAKQFQKLFGSSIAALLGLALLLAVVLFLFAVPLVKILYGNEFSPSVSVLRTLAWVLVPMAISHYLSLMLLAASGERAIMIALAASAALLAVAIWLALPLLGLAGAAWAMLAAETLQAGILLIAWRKRKTS